MARSTAGDSIVGDLLYKASPNASAIFASLSEKNWPRTSSFIVFYKIDIIALDNTIEAAVTSSHQSLAGCGKRVGPFSLDTGSKLPPPYGHTSLGPSPGTIQLLCARLTTTTASELRLLICRAILWTGKPHPTNCKQAFRQTGHLLQ